MQKTAEIVNSSNVAPISNVALCLGSLRRIMDRPQYLPGISVFYGPSGYGKSTAASVAVIRNNACCVQVRSLWTKKNLFEAICKGLGLRPGRTLGEMLDQIAEELALSGRPLIIDEADYLVAKGNVELIRDIFEASQAPIMLIGEENLPSNLRRWERFHGRVLDWCPAQPMSMADVKELYKFNMRGDVEIADDLLHRIYEIASGSARRVVSNISLVGEVAKTEGRKVMTLADWGGRAFYTGEAPRRGR